MADNIILNPGTGGDTSAADDIGGVKFQRVKMVIGADGVNDGDVSNTNNLPVCMPETLVTGAASQSASGNNIILASAGSGAYDAANYRSINIQINFSAGISAGQVTFEQSNDQTNWISLPLQNLDINHGFLRMNSVTAVASTTVAFGGKISLRYVRARISVAFTGGTCQAFTYFRQHDFNPIERGQGATYRAASAAVLVAAVTANVPWFVIYGSSTKVIKVQKIIVSGITLTAVAYVNIGVAKYSTAPSGGTAVAYTKIPLDASDVASTASLVQGYTAIPTTGTRIGFINGRRTLGQATTAAAAGFVDQLIFDFSTGSEKDAVTLRGTAQGVGLEWVAAPASATSVLVSVEWTEEPLP